MTNYFIVVASILFFALALIWTQKTGLNFLIKLLLFVVSFWGAAILLSAG